jgi:hypothetical protein
MARAISRLTMAAHSGPYWSACEYEIGLNKSKDLAGHSPSPAPRSEALPPLLLSLSFHISQSSIDCSVAVVDGSLVAARAEESL